MNRKRSVLIGVSQMQGLPTRDPRTWPLEKANHRDRERNGFQELGCEGPLGMVGQFYTLIVVVTQPYTFIKKSLNCKTGNLPFMEGITQ